MTDDIVTRLRAQSAFNKNHRFADLLDDWAGEAADEIERLRKIMRNVKAMEMCDANDPCEMCKEAAAHND